MIPMENRRYIKISEGAIKDVNAVLGQLSDGKWENDSRMNPYWICNDCGPMGILVRQQYKWDDHVYKNPLWDKTDEQAKWWFGNRLKEVVNDYLDYYGGEWGPDNNDVCSYIDYGRTVADAYASYVELTGKRHKTKLRV